MLHDNWDLFLLEKGRFVSIRVAGRETGCDAARLAQVFPALELAGKNYLAYEPERRYFRDDVAGLEINAPDSEEFNRLLMETGANRTVNILFDLMADFDRIKADVENPYFGMTPEAIAQAQAMAALAATDAGMGRVVEDLITALTAKGLISPADLPQVALDRLSARQALRVTLK